MKKLIYTLTLMSVAFTCLAQNSFDRTIKEISLDLAGKLKLLERKKAVVLFVTDINKTVTTAGTYIADNISYNLVNDPSLKIFERENLQGITEAKKLIDEGYISAEKTKELGKLLAVNAIIVGNYTILNNTIKLSLKALSTDNGVTIAASMINLPLNLDICKVLNINCSGANEDSQDSKCKEKSTGDYCFINNKPYDLNIRIKDSRYRDYEYTVISGEKQCIYDLPSGAFTYNVIEDRYKGGYNCTFDSRTNKRTPEVFQVSGTLYVETCKQKIFTFK